jgi:myosin-5
MAHIYEVGTRAWQPDPTEGWLASEVKEKLVDGEKVQLVFEVENGEVSRTRALDAHLVCFPLESGD